MEVRETRDIALLVARLAQAKKAKKICILDVRNISTFCDYFVILSGDSIRQVNAFKDAIQEELSKQGVKSLSLGLGQDESGWVVLDYVGVLVHIFHQPMREFYSLERLWSAGRKVRIPKNPS